MMDALTRTPSQKSIARTNVRICRIWCVLPPGKPATTALNETRYGSSLASVEADLAGGQRGDGVVGVVDAAVMVRAQQPAGVHAGGPALNPRNVVVRVAPARRGLAVLGGAASVAHAHRDPHALGVQPALAADVDDLALPADDPRDDPGG